MAQVLTAAPVSADDTTVSLPELTTASTVAQPHMADTTDAFCQVRDSSASTQTLSVLTRKAIVVSHWSLHCYSLSTYFLVLSTKNLEKKLSPLAHFLVSF